ncbi:hypothetical protein VNI00_011292 [Paramarasmius palmivorus]|uniref:GH16 domain-containing protein n=1 Tax=Paramarasmius palmivorus TaxID=297713 RepID=A0AAW0CGL0_9AGAR
MSLRLAVLAILAHSTFAQTWHLSQDFSGPTFFDGFNYIENVTDPSQNVGTIHTIGESSPLKSKMTFVDGNGRAIVKVDNETVGNPQDNEFGRNTIYLKSKQPMKFGSLLVADMNHIPYGCSVWPGLFTQGANWPQGGEFDLVEGINLQAKNQYALHTDRSHTCEQKATSDQQTGTTTFGDCGSDGNNNRGCTVQEASSKSLGSSFAGGAYALAWDEQGVRTWFFERGSLPTGIDTNPDPSKWPEPSAFYPASGCDPKAAFADQVITLAINICGNWAVAAFGETCSSVASQCVDLVRNPANYNNAYWEFNYIRVYTSDGTSTNTNSGSSTPTKTGSTSSTRASTSASAPASSQSGGSNVGVSLKEHGLLRNMVAISALILVPAIVLCI